MSSKRLLSEILYTALQAGASRVFLVAEEHPLVEVAGQIHLLARYLPSSEDLLGIAGEIFPGNLDTECDYDAYGIGRIRVRTPLERDSLTLIFEGCNPASAFAPATDDLAWV